MEPTFLFYKITDIIALITPFLAFFVGVFISIKLELNGQSKHSHVVLMSIPVGLLTIGNLLMATNVNGQYGFMGSAGQYLIFIGTVMLYGTLVPQLFESARSRISSE